ncbi:lysophospholipid hydrolase [Enteropsectra breve]|nr:lysophospholipid hydrolase [Enteropsectra breve]
MLLQTCFLIITALIVIYITRRGKAANKKYQDPIVTKRKQRDKQSFLDEQEEMINGFMIYNGLGNVKGQIVENAVKISAGVSIEENFYIVSGTIGIFHNRQQIGTLRAGDITLSSFELLGLKFGAVRRTLTDVMAAPLPAGNRIVSLYALEKTCIEPVMRYFRAYDVLLQYENIFCNSFSKFLSEFNIEKRPRTLKYKKNEAIDLDRTVAWVESGALNINGTIFTRNRIFGYLGLVFSSCSQGFTVTAESDTTIQCVSYEGIFVRPPLDISIFERMLCNSYSTSLVGSNASLNNISSSHNNFATSSHKTDDFSTFNREIKENSELKENGNKIESYSKIEINNKIETENKRYTENKIETDSKKICNNARRSKSCGDLRNPERSNELDFLFLVGLTTRWDRVPPYYKIISAGDKCEDIYLVENIELGTRECISNEPFKEDYSTKSASDLIKISSRMVERAIHRNPEFYKTLHMKMTQKRVINKVVLIVPSENSCLDFVNKLHRALFSDSILIRNRDVLHMMKNQATGKIGELILKSYLDSLKSRHKIIMVYMENTWSRVLRMFSRVSDLIFVVGTEITPNIFDTRIVEFVQLYTKREPVKRTANRLLRLLSRVGKNTPGDLIHSDDESASDDEFHYINSSDIVNNGGINNNGINNDINIRNNDINIRNNENKGALKSYVDIDPLMQHKYPLYRRIHHVVCSSEQRDAGTAELPETRTKNKTLKSDPKISCDSKDFERLARYLLEERVGLVLGGGGARGFAHVGVIKALEEENIVVDCIGGTSMGAFIGAAYASENDFMSLYLKGRALSRSAASTWKSLLDLTFPYVSMFSGKGLERHLKNTFRDMKIQNLWLEFYCVTTSLLKQDEHVHFNGPVWKWVRASMSLCGLLPPVYHKNEYYLDGAYMNNVPADVMKSLGVSKVIAVDVTDTEADFEPYDSKSGLVLLLKRWLAFKKYLSWSELQYRLAFLSTTKKIRNLENETLLIRPNLHSYKGLDFKYYDEIVAKGYEAAKATIQKWREEGLISKRRRNTRTRSI